MPKLRDLSGQRFGSLTVLERTEQTRDRYALWRCRCDCGNETLVSTRELTQGLITTCGCVDTPKRGRGRAAADLSGQRFGALTVLKRVENRDKRTYWLCRCDCGREHTVSTQNLRRGSVKSCGCLQREGGRCTDLAGQRFGRLTAVEPTQKRDPKGSRIWRCVCDCGSTTEVSADRLQYGGIRSCGCLRQEIKDSIPDRLHHIDGTCIEWLESRKHRSDNSSGFRGVTALPNGKYRAGIGFKKRRFHIGVYDTYDQAVEARLEAEELIHSGFVEAYRDWTLAAEKDPLWAGENPLVFEVEKTDTGFRITRESVSSA